MKSQLSIFCKAVYVRQQPHSSQAKFLKALCVSAGSTWSYDDGYGRKLSNGNKELTEAARSTFPTKIDAKAVSAFLRQYLESTTGPREALAARCSAVAEKARLPASLEIQPQAFVTALADWFIAIIKNPEDCDILATAYQLRSEGESNSTSLSFAPLNSGDRVIVSKPPRQQDYSKGFWTEFSHEWVLQNRGTVDWRGRSLICINVTDNGVRPHIAKIPVPETGPNEFVRVSCSFETRGREGKATSQWMLTDDNDRNCFPNHGTSFDVVVNVVNTDAIEREVT